MIMSKYYLKHLALGLLLALASTASLDAARKNLLKREHSASPVFVENPFLKHARIAPPADEPLAAPIAVRRAQRH
jgi:hypothetical protein